MRRIPKTNGFEYWSPVIGTVWKGKIKKCGLVGRSLSLEANCEVSKNSCHPHPAFVAPK